MDLEKAFGEYIRSLQLFTSGDKLLLAVSGGVDSMVLCELCHRAGLKFGIAHCNFQLRDEESDRDEAFVRDAAIRYNVSFHVIRFDTKKLAGEKKLSTQEVARELRYHWFDELRKSTPYDFVLTAHHADDNIETVTMNFFRGTGIRGIRGMEPRQDHLVRPLLFARRKQLEEFSRSENISFVTDKSNLEDHYTRNYFRLQVLPLVEKVFPGANENLLHNINRFRDVETLYHESLARHKKKLMVQSGKEIHIPVLKLKKTPACQTVLFEILSAYGFSAAQSMEALSLLDSETGRYISSDTHRLVRNRQWLIIAPVENNEEGLVLIGGAGKWNVGSVSIEIEQLKWENQPWPKDPNITYLDAAEIKFPLILRRWKQGDYFYPLGMPKKKKLARFFIDQKLSRTQKENIRVLEMDKKILWIPGYRIDDRFKVTGKTMRVLKVSFLGAGSW